MGIELPRELAGVADQAGVSWPEADEEAMSRAARAWRDAAESMSSLTTDADTAVRSALSGAEGQAADAASRHWSSFVEPDSGHLSAVQRGCADAANRLDHAANQVGTAKVEIIRNLVALARNSDAAHEAAAAGHPSALAGLDTMISGTAANVANIEQSLASAVQATSGLDMATVANPVDPNPGANGPEPGNAVASTLDRTAAEATELAGGVTGDTTDAALDVVERATGEPVVGRLVDDTAASETLDRVEGAAENAVRAGTDTTRDTADWMTDEVAETLPGPRGDHPGRGLGRPDEVDLVPGGPGSGPAVPGGVGPVGPGGPGLPGGPDGPGGPGGPDGPVEPGEQPDLDTGPIPVLPPGPGGPAPAVPPEGADAPTPPHGQTVQAGFAGGFVDAPPAAPAGPAPAAGGAPAAGPVGGQPGLVPGPGGAAPGPPAAGAVPPGGPVPGGQPGQPGQHPGGQPGLPAQRGGADRGVLRFGPVAPDAGGPQLGKGAATGAAPPGAVKGGPPGAPPPVSPGAKGQPDVLAVFWLHMFPIGHLPVASNRPARQLPPPHAELDYAAGMRFVPGDHPRFDLVDSTDRREQLLAARRDQPGAPPGTESDPVPPVGPGQALAGDDPAVTELAEGHDPLGGQHERDWDRRYLVRFGSVTSAGISSDGVEFAWPPSEQYPEGGTAPGEAEVLSAGAVLDRFGTPDGRVFAADGTPFANRSLPPAYLELGYRRYRVLRDLPVWRTASAAWFAQPGGGERFRTTHSAVELVALGYLADITAEPRDQTPPEPPADQTAEPAESAGDQEPERDADQRREPDEQARKDGGGPE